MILAIYGAGGLGREIIEILYQMPSQTRWDKIVFIDDTKDGETLRNFPIYSFENFKQIYPSENVEILIAVVEPVYRKLLHDRVKSNGYKLGTLIHPNVHVPETTHVGKGVIINAFAIVSCDSHISDNVLMQRRSVVSHDCYVGENTTLAADAALAGFCSVGKNTFLGINVKLKQKTTIGNNTIIGIGSVVTRDLPDGIIAYGTPAKEVRKNVDGKIFN